MQVHTFIADSAADAITQIRAQLGSEAVVLNVRSLPAEGFSRLWQKPRIEVLAHLPAPAALPAPAEDYSDLRQELAAIRARMEHAPISRGGAIEQFSIAPRVTLPEPTSASLASGWQVESLLERSGLSPLAVQRILDQVQAEHGARPPNSLAAEVELARAAMTRLWRPAPEFGGGANRPHVFVGAPGAGKTTVLCKWLAQTVLVENKASHVWRLDAATANTAEALSVYGEILGVPVARFWHGIDEADGAAITFADLPGVAWRKPAAIMELGRQITTLGPCHIHLVVNAAYEVPILLAQARAFATLPLADVIVTHLDEEPRWGKLWNLALGTNLPLRFLSAGQNVPGEFFTATPEKIFAQQFAGKEAVSFGSAPDSNNWQTPCYGAP